MLRFKSVCSKWTLVLVVVVIIPYVFSRPQEISSSLVTSSTVKSISVENATESIRSPTSKSTEKAPELSSTTPTADTPRDVKTKGPVIRDSIKMVANQLLDSPNNSSKPTVISDTRIPPKLKNQLANKHKIKTRNEDGPEPIENSHAGIAVPVTMEELEHENKISDIPNESSTSNEGISTWILLSNPTNKDEAPSSTEPTKAEDVSKKPKPASKNKTKRPQTNKAPVKRPIIGSTNKSDLVAGGSAINENVFNKIKDTVLTNVQKNKNSSTQKPTTITSTTAATTVEIVTSKKETVTKTSSSIIPVTKVTSKPTKKKNKIKVKSTTTSAPNVENESALLPMEPKEQEIELEISTPPTTTKKPKRKKNKTKKRKTSKPKPETETSIIETKTGNKTKSSKPSKITKNPASITGPITTQLYNYFSREVMPSVGVGVIGLASIVGIASYFLYPFAAPVRRTFEVDKKDDLYRHNAEEYANEGNGQAEEEMLGTVLAGMPAHSKQKLNPYAAQTPQMPNRYPAKKEQDIRYRQVATNYDPKYNVRYPQQKTGLAHGAVYPEPTYNPHQYETRHAYTPEVQYAFDKGANTQPSYQTYPAVEPIYAAPQTGPSAVGAYGSDTSNSVVYGVKPSADTDFKPVYPYKGQSYSETTSNPPTYPPTSMYLGSNNDSEQEDVKYDDEQGESNESIDNKFVVGNVPKEFSETATPAVVPEHGPRKLNRKRRAVLLRKRSIPSTIEEILKNAKANKDDDILSNEIDEALGYPIRNLAPEMEKRPSLDATAMPDIKELSPVFAGTVEPSKETIVMASESPTTESTDIIESVSTVPIDNEKKVTTESDTSNELDATTKKIKVYEVFPSSIPTDVTDKSSPLQEDPKSITTTTNTNTNNMNTETTTEIRSETTSTIPPQSTITDTKIPTISLTLNPNPTYNPEVITYPPLNQEGGFFTFLKRLVEFKYRLGLSILQTTSDQLNRYLRSMGNNVANASKKPL